MCDCGYSWSDPNVKHYCKIIGKLMENKNISEGVEDISISQSEGAIAASHQSDKDVARESMSAGMDASKTKGATKKKKKHKSKRKLASGSYAFGLDDEKANHSNLGKGDSSVQSGDHAENIKVLVRIRPLLAHEAYGRQAHASIEVEGKNTVSIHSDDAAKNIQCRYDSVLGSNVTQEEVYKEVHDSTASVVNGFNATIFAYGQTGSGKTFTMFGPSIPDLSVADQITELSGLIPRAVKVLFDMLAQSENLEFSVFCSFVQIYNEELYDMLRDPKRGSKLTIHEDKESGIYVQGLSEYSVRSVADCINLIQVGEDHRAVRETHMNEFSSRSHSIFQLMIEQRRADDETGGERMLRSKFNLVDLAGSERWDMKSDMVDEHISEMTNINLSLYTLGRCIAALSTKKGLQHVPYRESKLTRLLQDSLGGNTKTRLIATLSPASDCIDESISTLRFADRAKNVMVYLHQNEQRPVDYAVVLKLKKEIMHLRGLLKDLADRTEGGQTILVLEQQLLREKQQVAQLKSENTALRARSKSTSALVSPEYAATPEAGNSDDEQAQGFFVTQIAPVSSAPEGSLDHTGRGVSLPAIPSATSLEPVVPVLHPASAPSQNPMPTALQISEGNQNQADVPNPDMQQFQAYINTLEANNSILMKCIDTLHSTSKKFFSFEIEEEDLKGEIDRIMNQMKKLQTPASPAVRMKKGGILTAGASPLMSPKMAYLTSARQTNGNALVPRAPAPVMPSPSRPLPMGFRVRGKRADEMIKVVNGKNPEEAEDERQLKAQLKKAKSRMKKNKKLADWLKQKEDRKLFQQQQEEEERKALHDAEKEKRRKFKEHQKKQKKKLEKYYAELHALARDDDQVAETTYSPQPTIPVKKKKETRRSKPPTTDQEEEHSDGIEGNISGPPVDTGNENVYNTQSNSNIYWSDEEDGGFDSNMQQTSFQTKFNGLHYNEGVG